MGKKETQSILGDDEAKGRIKDFNKSKFLMRIGFVTLLIGWMVMPLTEIWKDGRESFNGFHFKFGGGRES